MRNEDWTDADCESLGITCEDTPEVEGEYSCEEALEAIDEALTGFICPPGMLNGDGEEEESFLTGDLECVCCGRRLDGVIGSFEWGIVNGEGQCCYCGWPYRVYHRPKLGGEEFATINVMLAAHPNEVELNEEES